LAVSHEIRRSVAQQGLGFYKGGPGRDYRKAKTQFVVSVLLIDPVSRVSRNTKVLLVTRDNGKKTNVSGYADVMVDPADQVRVSQFDIVTYAALAELREECGLSQPFTIRPGGRFVEKVGDVTKHILTVGAFYKGARPKPVPDGVEVLACNWVPLHSVRRVSSLSAGYLANTLPHSLMAFGVALPIGRGLIR
jgi:hypothetical protein